jgi:hypothetical protein
VLDRGHVNQKPAGQRNVRSYARAFFSNRFFGNLDQYFLTLAQKVGDRWLITIATRKATALTATTASPIARGRRLCRWSGGWTRSWGLGDGYRFFNWCFGSDLRFNILNFVG